MIARGSVCERVKSDLHLVELVFISEAMFSAVCVCVCVDFKCGFMEIRKAASLGIN